MSLGKEMGLILNTMAQQGLQPKYTLSGGGAEGNTELIDVAGAAANGLIYSAPGSLNPEADPRAPRFSDCYEAKEGNAPDTYAAHFYDGTLVIAEALKLGADATSSESMRDHIAQVDEILGVSGLWGVRRGRRRLGASGHRRGAGRAVRQHRPADRAVPGHPVGSD